MNLNNMMSKFCTKCGAEIPSGANFCEKCGTPVSGVPVNNMPADKNQKQEPGKNTWLIRISTGVGLLDKVRCR